MIKKISFLIIFFFIIFFGKNIYASTLTITSPNAGDVFQVGDNLVINWVQEGLSSVRLSLLENNSSTSRFIESIYVEESDPGTYEWVIPGEINIQGDFKVSAITYPIDPVESNGSFFSGVFTINSNIVVSNVQFGDNTKTYVPISFDLNKEIPVYVIYKFLDASDDINNYIIDGKLEEQENYYSDWTNHKDLNLYGAIEGNNPMVYFQVKDYYGGLSDVYNSSLTPPTEDIIISDIDISDVTINSAVLSWKTSSPASYRVKLAGGSSDAEFNVHAESSVELTNHRVELKNLTENTRYYVTIEAIVGGFSNYAGGSSWMNQIPFTTLKDDSNANQPIDEYSDLFQVPENILPTERGDDYLYIKWQVANSTTGGDNIYFYKDSGVYYATSVDCIKDLSCASVKRGDVGGLYYWDVKIEGLKPGTVYYYKFYADGKVGSSMMEASTTGTVSSNPSPTPQPAPQPTPSIIPQPTPQNKINIIIKNRLMHQRLKGKIMLKVEDSGKAYYVHPQKETMHYLGRPADAFQVMREQGVGITTKDLEKIPVGLDNLSGADTDNDGLSDLFEDAIATDKNNPDTDGDGYNDKQELTDNYNPKGGGVLSHDLNFTTTHKGKIFLQVEGKGEAWYINPNNGKRYFLGRPADAFNVMRQLSLGISNNDFSTMAE
jgi:hypothetical protein